jgi:hypothetical protein
VQFESNPFVKDWVLRSDLAFTVQLYSDFERRFPSMTELSAQLSEAGSLKVRRNEAIMNFATKGDRANARALISRLYFGTYLRAPDGGGLDYWTAEYVKAPTRENLDRIATLFATAPEFVARYGGLNNRQFIGQMYRSVLERDADDAGLSFWEARMNAGEPRGVMLANFTESAEFVAKSNRRVFISVFTKAC